MKKIKGTIISYKGFDKDLKCRDFQYEVGETYTHDGKVDPCVSGFHACTMPLSVLSYYDPAGSRYCVVEQSGRMFQDNDKVASSTLTVKREIDFLGLAAAQIEWARNTGNEYDADCSPDASTTRDKSISSTASNCSVASSAGDRSISSATGTYSVASATGDNSVSSTTEKLSISSSTGICSISSSAGGKSVASSTEWGSVSSSTGWGSVSSNSGSWAIASSTGNYSASSITGDWSVSLTTGQNSIASSSGDNSVSSSTGLMSSASASGSESVAFVSGRYSKAKASKGSWVVIAERTLEGEIVCVKTAKAGADIKADVYYKLVDGEFVEC